jgi:mannose-6-phosphate isomerase
VTSHLQAQPQTADVPADGPDDSAGRTAGIPQAEIYPASTQAKPWGQELIFAVVPGKYVGKVIQVNAGHSLSLQYHREKEETISMLTGEALVRYGPAADQLTDATFRPGDTIHLPPGVLHRITAVTDVTFVESSTASPGWREDVVRLEDAYGRTGTSAP